MAQNGTRSFVHRIMDMNAYRNGRHGSELVKGRADMIADSPGLGCLRKSIHAMREQTNCNAIVIIARNSAVDIDHHLC